MTVQGTRYSRPRVVVHINAINNIKWNKKMIDYKKYYRLSITRLFSISSISFLEWGSATVGTDFKAPFGTQEIAAIILDTKILQQ